MYCIEVRICLNLLQFWAIDIYWRAWCSIMASTTFAVWFVYNFGCKFLCNRFWIMNFIILFTFFHHFIALLSIRQSCKFFIYCDLAWNSIMETIIFSTWFVTSSVESWALTTFGANFWATGLVFSVHWATLLLIASGVSSKLFLKN